MASIQPLTPAGPRTAERCANHAALVGGHWPALPTASESAPDLLESDEPEEEDSPKDEDDDDEMGSLLAPNLRISYSIGDDEMPRVSITECPAGDSEIQVCWGDGECSKGQSDAIHHRYDPPVVEVVNEEAGTDPIQTHTAEITYRGVTFEIPIEWADDDIMRCWATGNAGAAAPVGYSFGECDQRNALPLEACTSGESCGESYCSPGLECCNALCGICTPPGMLCIQGCGV